MGITKTTYHIRNGQPARNEYQGDDKRLVVLIEDTFNGLNIEKAMLLKTIIENWLRSNGINT